MPNLVIGIDPGLSGALALHNGSGLMAVTEIPVVVKGAGKGSVKNEVNAAGLVALLREWVTYRDEVLVVVERVSAMPKQGVASMMSLGDTVGAIRGVIAARGLPIEWITPKDWKKHFGLKAPPEENDAKRSAMIKELARARAIQLYPEVDFHRKKDHNRAEAALIARYGWDVLR